MEDQSLRCNNRTENGGICRKVLKESVVVTTCSHVLCEECAKSTGFLTKQTNHRVCPVCKQPLPNIDDAANTNLQPTEEYKSSVLCGFDPTTIMECASSALSFWNYQMLQETAYQQHLLLALSKKYSHLNESMNNLVEDANNEIGNLHNKIDGMTDVNQKLQQKNNDLADACRERSKKYVELRKGYEILKQKERGNEQNLINKDVAEHTINTFAMNPGPEAMGSVIKGKPFADVSNIALPIQLPNTHPVDEHRSFETIRQPQGSGSGSQYSGDHTGMHPPHRPIRVNRISPLKHPPQHRTPLPGAFGASSKRSPFANSATPASYPNNVPPFGSSHRQSVRAESAQFTNTGRPNRSNNHGGISAGMKVGEASVGPQSRFYDGYVPGPTYIRRDGSIAGGHSYP